MSQVLELNPGNFTAEVLQSELPVLVDFWAPWCGQCRMMSPILDNLATELVGQIKIVKVNVDDSANQSLAVQYGIQGIPNLKLFKAGQEIADFVGMRQQDSLRQDILAKIA
jgi:thioredoxin 1